MASTHIPVAQAARELPDLLARVRAGEDIVIDDGSPVPVRLAPETSLPGPLQQRSDCQPLDAGSLQSPQSPSATLSEAIARLKAIERERGYPAIMDEDYAADMREIIANRKPRDTSAWD